jgi:hypothetical protein
MQVPDQFSRFENNADAAFLAGSNLFPVGF